MRLSEAIRLGAMLSEQGRNGSMEPKGPRCALAAASDAVGIPAVTGASPPFVNYVAIERRWPILGQTVAHPLNGMRDRMWVVIYVLNDCTGWTREQIADWVEGIERAQEWQAVAAGDVVPTTV